MKVNFSFVWPKYLKEFYGERLYDLPLRDGRFSCDLEVAKPDSLAHCLIALAQKLRSLQAAGTLQGVSKVWAWEKNHGQKAYLVFTYETRSFILVTAETPVKARVMVRGVTREEIINCYRVNINQRSSPVPRSSRRQQAQLFSRAVLRGAS